jgi:RimJ/RimL family protein N-acetyltransferase
MAHLPLYRIETERVTVRCYTPSDAPAMSETILFNDAYLAEWMPWAGKGTHTPQFCTQLLRQFRGNFDLGIDYTMGVWDARDGRYIGGTGYHPRVGDGAYEIGYWIDRRYAGQGLATHVAGALTKAAFEFGGVHRMNIHMQVGNLASERVTERLGYKREGLLRQFFMLKEGQYADIHVFSMLREDYDASALKAIPIRAFGIDDLELTLPIPT